MNELINKREERKKDKHNNNKLFSDVCYDMMDFIADEDDTEVSVDVAFVCLLHLANENRLELQEIES